MKGRLLKWEDDLLGRLRDQEFAREYVQTCLEEGLPITEAVSAVIRAHGLDKVAKRAHMAKPNLLRAVRAGANPTLETLRQLLNSIGMDVAVRSLKPLPRKRVAVAR